MTTEDQGHLARHELATVVPDLDRPCVIEVLDGRDRRTSSAG